MNIVEKIVRADANRKTRFHDEQENLVAAGVALRNLPRAAWTYLLWKLTGRRPMLPWISYDAINRIDGLLGPDSRVLEFGSGLSTLWFAERCRWLHSVEHDEGCYGLVSGLLESRGLVNVGYELRTADDYAELSDYEAPAFDFCIVDGIERLRCVENAIPLIVRGGFIFLDNSDVGEPERQRAVALMRAAAERAGGAVEFFTDFAPAQVHANQGMLAKL